MNLEDFLPEVYLEAPQCPEIVALNALRNALREFCAESKLWSANLTAISLVGTQADYPLTLPTDAEASEILSAKYNGAPVKKILTRREMDEEFGDWETTTGDGVQALINGFRTVRAFPIPVTDAADALVLHAALMPTTTASTCLDELFEYHEGIAGGAIARLKAMPNKPWTDREGAPYYAGLFQTATDKATSKVLGGRTKRPSSITPVSYF